jgi:hypothetical protein
VVLVSKNQGDKTVKMGITPDKRINPILTTEDGQDGGLIRTPTTTVDDPTQWHHSVFVRDAGELQKLYVDGVRVGAVIEKNLETQFFVEKGLLDIGASNYYDGGWEVPYRQTKWEGLLDEMYIYNRELTDSEVQALYNAGGLATPPQTGCNGDTQRPDNLCDGLIALYPMNGDPNDVSVGGNNGTVDGATLTEDRFGNANSAYSFNGSSKITVPDSDSFINQSQFTVGAWVKWESGKGTIVQQGGWCPNTATNFKGSSFGFIIGDDKLKMSVNSGTGNYYEASNSIQSHQNFPQDANWHFVTSIFDNGELSLYVDGVRDSAQTKYFDNGYWINSTTKPSAESTQFTMMADSYDDIFIGSGFSYCGAKGNRFHINRLKGAIDDIQMYNRVLTDAEIQSLYNAANPVSQSMLEDAEDGDTTGWFIYDEKANGGAALSNVFDSDKNSQVIELAGNSSSGYKLSFDDSTNFIARWSMKTATSDGHTIYWHVKTSGAVIYLEYRSDKPLGCHFNSKSTYAICGLGLTESLQSNSWHTITRDFKADLKAVGLDIELQSVEYLLIHSAGRVDNIQLLKEMPPIDCNTVTEIPTAQCEALVALYDSTDGDNWTNNDGWKTTDTPCSWFGVYCENGVVTAIDLDNNNLTGTLPDWSALTRLQELLLGHNKITETVPELSNLTNLKVLSLKYNDLSGAIPELSHLSQLTTLWLEGNNLTGSIPDLSGLSSLTGMHLAANH